MPENQAADSTALSGLYLEGAAFKGQIIEALAAAGIPVHSIKHTGEYHSVQIPTPPRLRSPELFAQWRRNHPADVAPASEPVPESPKE